MLGGHSRVMTGESYGKRRRLRFEFRQERRKEESKPTSLPASQPSIFQIYPCVLLLPMMMVVNDDLLPAEAEGESLFSNQKLQDATPQEGELRASCIRISVAPPPLSASRPIVAWELHGVCLARRGSVRSRPDGGMITRSSPTMP